MLTYSRNLNQQPFSVVAIKAVHLACHRNLVWGVKRREGKNEKWIWDERMKDHSFFPFLPALLKCHKDPQKVVAWCHTSLYRRWDCSCPGNIPLATGWEVLGFLPVRSLCCDCAFIWIMGSVLPYVWLLSRAHVQTLGISQPISRALQECWRSWQLHRCAGIPHCGKDSTSRLSWTLVKNWVPVPGVWQYSLSIALNKFSLFWCIFSKTI